MTTNKYFTTYSSGGYTIADNTNIYISATGGFGGEVIAGYSTVIGNLGRMGGVYMGGGGQLFNGTSTNTSASISGFADGVFEKNNAVSISNYGTIEGIGPNNGGGRGGVVLDAGGLIINGSVVSHQAFIGGASGILCYGGSASTIHNYGSVIGRSAEYYGIQHFGVKLERGGTIVNGSLADTSAVISGSAGIAIAASGGLANFGKIVGSYKQGAVLYTGGNVSSGAVTDTVASIAGITQGVVLYDAGTVTNFGAISALGAAHGDAGVELNAGGRVLNGGAGDTVAQISGYTGVLLTGAGTVINFGGIAGQGQLQGEAGVDLTAGGNVVNGAAASPGANISGYSGVILGAAGTVANYGDINGFGVAPNEFGVYLAAGGTVINGAGTDRKATIEGAAGVGIVGGAGTIHNGGTIQADDNDQNAFGVRLAAGGLITNGSANNHNALIQGAAGLYMVGGSGLNFGTISGVGDSGSGVKLTSGASITNGALRHTGAIIEGYNGVATPTGGAGTVTNFGTIEGTNAAIYFRAASDVLNVEAGSTFLGAIYGGGGTLDLASGTGTISSLFASAGVVVSGSMAATTFQGFGTVEVGAGAIFTDAGAVTLAAGQTVNAAGALSLGGTKAAITNAGLIVTSGTGALTLAGAVANTGTINAAGGSIAITAAVSGSGLLAVSGGTLIVSGAVTGSGKASINGGLLEFTSTFTQNVAFGTTGRLQLAQSQTYTGTLSGFSKTNSTSLDLMDIGFVSASEATFSGTANGGVLTVTDGTHTAKINLKGNYTTSTFICSSDGAGGVIVVDPAKKGLTASPLALLGAMAGLGAPAGAAAPRTPAWSGVAPTLISPRPIIG